jgi:hypothetical protein
MIELTPSAQQRFDDYFRRLRRSMRGASPAEADDVEQSVREHIEVALAGAAGPVGHEQLAAVLDRLGAPDRWFGVAEPSLVQRVMERLRSGPEDWRLAYIAFGLFFLALLLMPVGVGALLMLASYAVSRAYVDFMETKDEVAGARRWLVYPPIALFLLIAVAFFVIGPAGPALAWGLGDHGFMRILDEGNLRAPYPDIRFAAGATAATLGTWWILASLIGMVFLPVSRFVFKPLLARVRRTHFLGLTLVGTLTLALGLALVWPWLEQAW